MPKVARDRPRIRCRTQRVLDFDVDSDADTAVRGPARDHCYGEEGDKDDSFMRSCRFVSFEETNAVNENNPTPPEDPGSDNRGSKSASNVPMKRAFSSLSMCLSSLGSASDVLEGDGSQDNKGGRKADLQGSSPSPCGGWGQFVDVVPPDDDAEPKSEDPWKRRRRRRLQSPTFPTFSPYRGGMDARTRITGDVGGRGGKRPGDSTPSPPRHIEAALRCLRIT